MIKIPFSLKRHIPGYAARWRRRYRALIDEIGNLASELEFTTVDSDPALRIRATGVTLAGFVTEPENREVYALLRRELPPALPESHFRLMKDYITRYKYPHMRPDLAPTGYSVEQLWGFHGQHKDAIPGALFSSTDQESLIRAFRGRPDDVFIDCGAFLGFGELRISPSVPQGHIVAVEASGDCFRLLRRNIDANGIRNVTPLHRAIWNAETEIELESSYAQANSLIAEVHRGERTQKVRTTTIDAIVRDNRLPKVDMISLTLNGAEVEALAGAAETLSHWHPRIRLAGWYSRNGRTIAEITRPILEGHGYRVFIGPRGNVMALHAD